MNAITKVKAEPVPFECPRCGHITKIEGMDKSFKMPCLECHRWLVVPEGGGLAEAVPDDQEEALEEQRREDWEEIVAMAQENTARMEAAGRRSVARRNGTVPVKLAMPKGLGTMEAEVTQETANSMASTFLGGMLVAIGVFLMAMVGIRRK